ncbi:MAG: amidohydrolase family protein, partial [Myxococcota bacterium]|nr:amidohydrolase family protein [Myxococcota bacterium]
MPTILQADLTYFEGRLQPDIVVHVGRDGLIEQISRDDKGVESVRQEGELDSPVPALDITNPGEFAVPRARRKHRLRGVALLPGFTNAHSHSFQRLLRGRTEHRPEGRTDSNFWTWRDAMYRVSEALTPEDIEAVAAFSFMEMLQAGFTHVVEFHYLHHQLGGRPYDEPAELS